MLWDDPGENYPPKSAAPVSFVERYSEFQLIVPSEHQLGFQHGFLVENGVFSPPKWIPVVVPQT